MILLILVAIFVLIGIYESRKFDRRLKESQQAYEAWQLFVDGLEANYKLQKTIRESVNKYEARRNSNGM